MDSMIAPATATEYEVHLEIFEGPLDLLLYLVQKEELNPREISIATITDQYLRYLDTIGTDNLTHAGEFLVMASRLIRLKTRELLPAEQKDELEEMEYELDRQMLIQQMLEYQKFKEAARTLRGFEAGNFGALPRGIPDQPGRDKKPSTPFEFEESEAGIYDLLAAFRRVVLSRQRIPVHEVEIDDVTIEDKMQEVETLIHEMRRFLVDDMFEKDNRSIVQAVTVMALLELAKLDRILVRQSHAFGPLWVYPKAQAKDFAAELHEFEHEFEELELKDGLVEIIKEMVKERSVKNTLESMLIEAENELKNPGQAAGANSETPMETNEDLPPV